MGIRFSCPSGHPLHVKEFLAGKRGICPTCGAKFVIPVATEPSPSMPVSTGNAPSPAAGEASQLAGASVVIGVMDPPVAPRPAPAPAVAPVFTAGPNIASRATTAQANVGPAVPPVAATSPVADSTPPSVDIPPVVVSDDNRAVSPVIKYTLSREKARRNRIRIAVLLLVIVILLAGALIWVLQVGPPALSRGGTPRPSWSFQIATCDLRVQAGFAHVASTRWGQA